MSGGGRREGGQAKGRNRNEAEGGREEKGERGKGRGGFAHRITLSAYSKSVRGARHIGREALKENRFTSAVPRCHVSVLR